MEQTSEETTTTVKSTSESPPDDNKLTIQDPKGEEKVKVAGKDVDNAKALAGRQMGPLILLTVAVLMILVSAIFVSITYYQVQKVKSISTSIKLPKNDSTYLLASLIIIWITFVISLILLGANYFNYQNTAKVKDNKLIIRNTAYLWISVVIVAILTMAVGLICLYLSFKFKVLSNALFTNILVAAITSLGGFIFVVIAAVFYGYNDAALKEFYKIKKEQAGKWYDKRKADASKKDAEKNLEKIAELEKEIAKREVKGESAANLKSKLENLKVKKSKN